jgi:hypothetical protein
MSFQILYVVGNNKNHHQMRNQRYRNLSALGVHESAPFFILFAVRDSWFASAYRLGDIPHQRNNWICYEFRRHILVPTHSSIRSGREVVGGRYMKSWLLEISTDSTSWTEVDHRGDNSDVNKSYATATFCTNFNMECRFVRLVNIGCNHDRNTRIVISAFEVFGSITENMSSIRAPSHRKTPARLAPADSRPPKSTRKSMAALARRRISLHREPSKENCCSEGNQGIEGQSPGSCSSRCC